MRNDARPIGEHAHDQSPIDEHETERLKPDERGRTERWPEVGHVVERDAPDTRLRPGVGPDPERVEPSGRS